MKTFLRSFAVLTVLGLLAASPLQAQKPGTGAPDFDLPVAGSSSTVKLKDLVSANKAVVVVFVATRCPYSNGYNTRLKDMAKDYAAKGVAFVGINSNKTEPASEVAEHAKKNEWPFPVVKDEGNKVADAYGAKRTPEVFVVEPRGNVIYHGRIDESYDEPEQVTQPDLKRTLDAILAGKSVPKAETKAFGCTIKRVQP
ncbi:MAG: thioredoxin family protein [Acidobacteria bacterium]|nr:thioredoxin family protein [Acidobacteriota bacterium]MCG3192377.1 Thiol-disulfide oxidoreductase ResA [Thermoanaerobaculia bacterium]MCK6685221.1 thioredoxin family protein [Thermoanaerobaculia bacterium]